VGEASHTALIGRAERNAWSAENKTTNMVLSAIKLALKEDTSTDVNKLLFCTGDHNNVTVTSGDKKNESLRIAYLSSAVAQFSLRRVSTDGRSSG
jgi:hypothetical protein